MSASEQWAEVSGVSWLLPGTTRLKGASQGYVPELSSKLVFAQPVFKGLSGFDSIRFTCSCLFF